MGGWCGIANPFSAEVVARAGFDWVCVDQQHGLVGPDGLPSMLQAIELAGVPSLVRVPWNEPAAIMRAFDAGATGVVVPLVNSRADAERAVRAGRYPPAGDRSWGPTRPAQSVSGYTPALGNERSLMVVQIETAEAVDALDDILDVDGVDAVFVGPSDLALSYGLAPTLTPRLPEHTEAILQVRDAARRRGVPAGIYCGDPAMARRWRSEGFVVLAIASDVVLLRAAATDAATRSREGAAP